MRAQVFLIVLSSHFWRMLSQVAFNAMATPTLAAINIMKSKGGK